MEEKISFFFINDNKNVDASHAVSILEALVAAKIEISHSCGGMGTCGTCRVFIEGEPLPDLPRTEIEKEMASERCFLENERLACQLVPRQNLRIRRA